MIIINPEKPSESLKTAADIDILRNRIEMRNNQLAQFEPSLRQSETFLNLLEGTELDRLRLNQILRRQRLLINEKSAEPEDFDISNPAVTTYFKLLGS